MSWGRGTKKCPVWAHCDKYNAGYLETMTSKECKLPDCFSLYDFLEVAFIYAQYPQPFLFFFSPLLPLFYIGMAGKSLVDRSSFSIFLRK